MSWVEIFAVFVVSHALGDYLLQTDWQATHKRGGLGGDRTARMALLSHVFTYTLAFVPARIWLATDGGLGAVRRWSCSPSGIYVPHMVQDDGRLLTRLHPHGEALRRGQRAGDLHAPWTRAST